jgi:hypothetical protein
MIGRGRGNRLCASAACGLLLAAAGCPAVRPTSNDTAVATTLAKTNVIFPIGERKEIALTVPADGKLYVIMRVQRGEMLAVRLIDQQEYSNYLAGRAYKSVPEFDATYVREYRKVHPVKAGNYYLVIFDPSSRDVAKHPFNDVNFRVFVLHTQ